MEACSSYRPWYDKASGKTFFKPTSGKCLHYYFYFIDEQFGLCYVRVPTWAPFRLQVYFNGHYWLARQLAHAGIGFEMADNAFLRTRRSRRGPAPRRQPRGRHAPPPPRRWARRFCPVLRHFRNGVHWSFMQVEYATDVVFRHRLISNPSMRPSCAPPCTSSRPSMSPPSSAASSARNYQGEVGNDFSTRIQGTRIRHHMGPASIKLYDKFGLIARVECTANDVTFFKHHRHVEQRNGERVFKLAPLRKSIYSLNDLRQLMYAANDRYLAFMACLDNPDAAQKALAKMAAPAKIKAAPSVASTCSSIPTTACSSPSPAASGRSPGFAPAICASTSSGSPRACFLPDQTPAHPWPDQESRPRLQVLLHQARTPSRRHRLGHPRVFRPAEPCERCSLNSCSFCRRFWR